jgi:hypothetical protein
LESGHRSYGCLRLASSRQPPFHRLAWRPLAATAVPAPAPSAASVAADRRGQDPPRRRTRRRRCHPSSSEPVSSPSLPPPASDTNVIGEASRGLVDPAAAPPLCVVHRLQSFDQAEAALWSALFMSIGGARPTVLPQQVLDMVAASFNVEPSSMAISLATPEDFLLSMPDSATADMVFNDGSPLHGSGFSLFFKRWTRLAHAEAAVLPTFIQVGLRGISAHAWERSTTQQLLRPSYWVQGLHEDMAARRDLSAF